MPRSSLCRQLPVVIAVLVSALALGCGDADRDLSAGDSAGRDGGTLIVAAPADISTLLPLYANAAPERMAVAMLFDRLAEPDDSMNTIGDLGFTPRLAERWEWSHDSLVIVFHLDPRARWHDGVGVRASDVVFTYRLYTNSAAGTESAAELGAIDSVTARDSLTAVFWFKRRYPEQFFDATYLMLICPAHLLRAIPVADLRASDFSHHPVGDGQFRFAGSPDPSTLNFVADTANYRGRPRLDRVVLSVTPSPGAAVTRLLSGDVDFLQSVPSASVSELAHQSDVALLTYADASYGFLWFNLRTGTPARPHPIFGDRTVRLALAMALDRQRIVRNVFDTLALVANGPFALATSSADPTAVGVPYDTAAANRLLDSAGWRRGPDGVRRKGGRPLAFSLVVPTSSKTRQQLAVLIQDALSRVGAKVSVDPIELSALMTKLNSRDFDAALQAWHTSGAMSDLRQTWTTSADRDGDNWGSYDSPMFDALVDSALTVTDPSRVHALLHRAYAVMNADVPAVWLYQPRTVVAVNRRVHTAFLRADAWYAHLADWYIPAGARLPRDNVGLAAAGRKAGD
jgi:peptide/nickel transport system substrate-binding protein